MMTMLSLIKYVGHVSGKKFKSNDGLWYVEEPLIYRILYLIKYNKAVAQAVRDLTIKCEDYDLEFGLCFSFSTGKFCHPQFTYKLIELLNQFMTDDELLDLYEICLEVKFKDDEHRKKICVK